ncbi:HAUS augmin-like complex subunit 2 isoform X1 [Phodopus roborovskii]|uniref:Haus2 protein n=2 Tax=Phodopus roborovskii TaxID=109678 RepID=A0AAU9Z5M8_PHORO|nr:HAUS augmin-like complex subunit 2 isoform X1 [Phodopus roborovskii]CAH6788019.1 Haus2 [Phodopus roborovskii]
MAAPNPWDPASAPSAAGLLLNHWVASGIVTEEMLDIPKKMAPCFVNFSRLQQISDIQAEIYQNNLEIELLKLEKDTADLIHPSYLVEKCDTLQSMNSHLETVLKERRAIRQRLLRPICQENLPVEAMYHRYMVHLLELAVTFIEKLENNLETIRNIPHLDTNLKKMSKALAQMDILVNKTEELSEDILKWREQQKEISLCIPKILSEENYLHKLDIVPPLPFVYKVHAQTVNAK